MVKELKQIKLECNITGKVFRFYHDKYKSKLEFYGDEELLKKFFISNEIISLLKRSYKLEDISKVIGFQLKEEKIEYYKELEKFFKSKNTNQLKIRQSSTTNTVETDSDVKNFINDWKQELINKTK